MSRTPKKVSIGIVEFALPVPRRGSIDALSGFGSGPQIGAEIHQRVQARRRRENPLQRAQRGLEVGVQRKGAAAGLPLPGAVGSMEHLRPLPCPVASVTMAQVSEAIALARRPAFIEKSIGRDPVPESVWWPGSREWPVPGSDGPSSLAGPAWRCSG
jgi:hypothetical protein